MFNHEDLFNDKVATLTAEGVKHTEAVRLVLRNMYGKVRKSKQDLKELDYWVWIAGQVNQGWTVDDSIFYTEDPIPTMNPWVLFRTYEDHGVVAGTLGDNPNAFPYMINVGLKDATSFQVGVYDRGDDSLITEARELGKLTFQGTETVEQKQKMVVDFLHNLYISTAEGFHELQAMKVLGKEEFKWWKELSHRVGYGVSFTMVTDNLWLDSLFDNGGNTILIGNERGTFDDEESLEVGKGITSSGFIRLEVTNAYEENPIVVREIPTAKGTDLRELQDLAVREFRKALKRPEDILKLSDEDFLELTWW